MAGVGTEKIQRATLRTVDNQNVQGLLSSIDESSGKITLKNVVINNMKLPGLHHFYASSIIDLELTDVSQNECGAARIAKEDKKIVQRDGRGMAIRSGSGNRSHAREPSGCDSGHDSDSCDQGIGSSSDDDYEDFYEMENFIMFCRTCDKFRDSITYLMNQDIIAVTFYGMDIGRNGALSVLQVATGVDVFVYDVLRLGLEGFVDGLKAVLESQRVLKVIHDCRMVSDALFHQYDVTLANVFDTQVGAVFAYRLCNDGDWPRFVESLPTTLMSQLGLRHEDVQDLLSRDASKQGDEVWLQRPLCNQLLQNSLKNLVHLIPLYHILENKLILEFHMGVQLYLDLARDTPQERVDKCMSVSHCLPYAFQDLPKHVANAAKEKPHFRSKRYPLCYKLLTTKHCNEGKVRGNAQTVPRPAVNNGESSSGSSTLCPTVVKSELLTDTRTTGLISNVDHRLLDSASNTASTLPSPSELSRRLSLPQKSAAGTDSSSLKNVSVPSSELNQRISSMNILESKPSDLTSNTRISNTHRNFQHTGGPNSNSSLSYRTTNVPSRAEILRRLSPTKSSRPAINTKSNEVISDVATAIPAPAEVGRRLLSYSQNLECLPEVHSDSPPPSNRAVSNYSPQKRPSKPSPANLLYRQLKSEEEVSGTDSEGYISNRSPPSLSRSALMNIRPPSCSSASSACSESLSETEIDYSGLDTGGAYTAIGDWDADKGLQLEMTQNILRHARRTKSSKTDIKKHLLPAKGKPSPRRQSEYS